MAQTYVDTMKSVKIKPVNDSYGLTIANQDDLAGYQVVGLTQDGPASRAGLKVPPSLSPHR